MLSDVVWPGVGIEIVFFPHRKKAANRTEQISTNRPVCSKPTKTTENTHFAMSDNSVPRGEMGGLRIWWYFFLASKIDTFQQGTFRKFLWSFWLDLGCILEAFVQF